MIPIKIKVLEPGTNKEKEPCEEFYLKLDDLSVHDIDDWADAWVKLEPEEYELSIEGFGEWLCWQGERSIKGASAQRIDIIAEIFVGLLRKYGRDDLADCLYKYYESIA